MRHKLGQNSTSGHAAALVTILIWGTTFISTKLLLVDFKPVEILFFRFVIGLIALFAACPRRLRLTERRQEITFAAAGLSGVCLYYLLENIALTYTSASNVGVIISAAPFFTAILNKACNRDESLKVRFFVGFVTAIVGICFMSFTGSELKLNLTGDLLAVAAAIVWAVYSILTKRISGYGYNTILTTRRVFCYGIIFMIPVLFIFDFDLELSRFANPLYLFNIVFLGLGASALCFVTWGLAVKKLGAVKTSVYIYLVPAVTVITSIIILREEINLMALIGIILTLFGLLISESDKLIRKSS